VREEDVRDVPHTFTPRVAGCSTTAFSFGAHEYRDTSLIKNGTLPQDHYRAKGIGLLYSPRRGVFLMSEVTL
jgi:hypothetical protein